MADEQEPLDTTLDLIYQHTSGGQVRQSATADAIDAKAVQSFAAASVVLGLGTFTVVDADASSLTGVFYCGAVVAYLWAGRATWKIVSALAFRVVDAADRWWPSHRLVEPTYLREQILDDLAAASDENRELLDEKGKPLNGLLVAVVVEAVLVAAAVIAALY